MLGTNLRPGRRTIALCSMIAVLALWLGACSVPSGAATSASTAPVLAAVEGVSAPLPPNAGANFPASGAPVSTSPSDTATAESGASTGGQDGAPALAEQPTPLSLPTAAAETAPLPAGELASAPVRLFIADSVPASLQETLKSAVEADPTLDGAGGAQPLTLAASADDANARLTGGAAGEPGVSLYERYWAAVVPFDTVQDDITLDELTARWGGSAPVLTTEAGVSQLPNVFGPLGESTQVVSPEEMLAQLDENRDAIGIVPFEEINPRDKVLTVDGANVLSNQLQEGEYPLVYQITASGEGASQLAARLGAALGPATNRDPGKLTSLVMTGVTAMARGTGAAIERAGNPAYPAEVIGPELAKADITHVSNEIPFIEGCVVNNTENNLQLCSDPSYWAALELMGTDIVGLSGNHVNDFGRDGARESLGWYKENKIPVYGSGLTVDSACAPLLWESHGNTFAFIAALAYGPESAWVTDTEPGSCYYYEHKDRIISMVETLSKAVDVVAVELQYEETYFPYPTPTQVEEFRELRAAGADLVTGVQSHVPQAQEPYGAYDEGGDGMISYGLGNLYFDQMWSWETRTELYARHAIYDGKLINTEILTGVLEDYAQPRWTTPEERAELLQTIFDGAPVRP